MVYYAVVVSLAMRSTMAFPWYPSLPHCPPSFGRLTSLFVREIDSWGWYEDQWKLPEKWAWDDSRLYAWNNKSYRCSRIGAEWWEAATSDEIGPTAGQLPVGHTETTGSLPGALRTHCQLLHEPRRYLGLHLDDVLVLCFATACLAATWMAHTRCVASFDQQYKYNGTQTGLPAKCSNVKWTATFRGLTFSQPQWVSYTVFKRMHSHMLQANF